MTDAMRRLSRAVPGRVVLVAALLTGVIVLATTLALADDVAGFRLGATGYGLLVAAGASYLLTRRAPLGAVAVALAATMAWYGTGLPGQTPLSIALVVTLYVAVDPERPARTLLTGAVAVAGVLAAMMVGETRGTVPPWLPLVGGWIAAPVVAGWVVTGRRLARARAAERAREEHARRRVAEERLRLARELHDVVSHSISVINVQAGVAVHVMDEHPERARDALVTIKATSKEVLREMRGILGVLRRIDEAEPDAPSPGLEHLEELVVTMRRARLPTTLEVRGERWPLPPAADLAAYRVVQEALTNTLRHAGDARAAVSLRWSADDMTVEVRDDGDGPAPGANGGWGLVGLRERVAAVGGAFSAGPGPAGGFVVRAVLPREPVTP